jgi:hypothetical protein
MSIVYVGIGLAVVHPVLTVAQITKLISAARFQVDGEDPLALTVLPERVGRAVPIVEITNQVDRVGP